MVQMDDFSFPHHRLEVYRLAMEMVTQAKMVANAVPRGYRTLADQMLRASSAVVLCIGEGASRFTPGSKRQRYSEARGECGEVASAAELLVALDLLPAETCEPLMSLTNRVGAMLTQLIKRFSPD